METTIKRLGNSKAIILPSHILKIFGLKVADRLTIKVVEQHIVLVPLQTVDYDSMKALFKGYKGSYRPKLEDDDDAKGQEVW
jgi:antitoxin component of MazEF toxin-antitoxin module